MEINSHLTLSSSLLELLSEDDEEEEDEATCLTSFFLGSGAGFE